MVILCVMKQNVYLNSLLFTHTLTGGSLRRHHGDEFCKQTENSGLECVYNVISPSQTCLSIRENSNVDTKH